jgi:hypothetical protein
MSAIFDSFSPRLTLPARMRLLLLTFWVGGIWTIGYVVAPALFSTLADPAQAGAVAGALFRIEAWASLGCVAAMVLLVSLARRDLSHARHKACLLLLLGMLVCTLMGYFTLAPMMASLREAAGPGGVMASEVKTQFAILHGLSAVLYLVKSVFGAVLVFKNR